MDKKVERVLDKVENGYSKQVAIVAIDNISILITYLLVKWVKSL